MNKNKLLTSPIFIVWLCAGCSLAGDTALDSTSTIMQMSSPANVLIRNQSMDPGNAVGPYGRRRAIMPGDLDGDGYDDMVVVEVLCAHIIYGAGTLPHTIDATNTATLVGSNVMPEDCSGAWTDPDPNPQTTPLLADRLGLAAAGDVDRDGFADFLVYYDGGDFYDPAHPPAYVGTYLVYGGPSRLTGKHLLADASAAFFTHAYFPTGLGDVNGDGFADFGAGSDFDDPNGTAAVFFGSATRFTGGVALDQADARLSTPAGYAVGLGLFPAGDLNGDGYADFVVGRANIPSDGIDIAAKVWFVLGGPAVVGALSLDNVPSIEGPILGWDIDFAVRLGDLDGDGFDDLAMKTFNGSAWDTNILFGRPDLSTLPGSPWDVTFPNTTALVSTDVDGNGIRDLILSDPSANNGNGVVYIRRGTGTRLSGSIDPTLADLVIPSSYHGNGSCSFCGESVGAWLSHGGDVDRDGLPDILVGASNTWDGNVGIPSSDPATNTGHAYLLRGAAIKASLSSQTAKSSP